MSRELKKAILALSIAATSSLACALLADSNKPVTPDYLAKTPLADQYLTPVSALPQAEEQLPIDALDCLALFSGALLVFGGAKAVRSFLREVSTEIQVIQPESRKKKSLLDHVSAEKSVETKIVRGYIPVKNHDRDVGRKDALMPDFDFPVRVGGIEIGIKELGPHSVLNFPDSLESGTYDLRTAVIEFSDRGSRREGDLYIQYGSELLEMSRIFGKSDADILAKFKQQYFVEANDE